ncbi:MAG TPA: phosphotransferase family protein, partial [Terriglobales bacterium]|nr:phosphotransferase family protein [Terriglobales bacterium]
MSSSSAKTESPSAYRDTAPIRPGEELNLAALAEYLRDKIEGGETGLSVVQFPSGHSNLSYLLRAGEREYVLRRGPLGPVAPKAHDMAREYRVLQAIHPHFPEAPKPYVLCEDQSVLGAVFFVMERRRGVILRERILGEILRLPNYPRVISEAFVRCLARLHAVDVVQTGLLSLGKPEGFLERQVQGWADRWNRAKTEPVPRMDEVVRWLAERLPPSPAPTIVHNDFKLDNLMLRAESPGQVEAVLDWEMATVGDPLADLGLTLCYWCWASAPSLQAHALPTLTAQPGWY